MGEQLPYSLYIGINESVIALAAHSRMPVADIGGVVQQFLPVCPDVQHYRDHTRWIDAARSRVDRQPPDRYLNAANPPIADSQDLFGVRSQHQVHAAGAPARARQR